MSGFPIRRLKVITTSTSRAVKTKAKEIENALDVFTAGTSRLVLLPSPEQGSASSGPAA